MSAFPSLRRLNGLYILLHLVYWAMFAAFAGYQTALVLNRGFSSADAGVFVAIRCLAGIFAQPLIGSWADRHRTVPLKRILVVCLLAALAVNGVLIAARPGFWGMAAIFLALGVLELNAYPLLDSMAVQFISVGLEIRYSLCRGLGSLSYAVSCVLLGRQAAALGVETLLWTHLGLLILMILVSAAFPAFPQEALPPLAEGERPHSVWYLIRSSRSFAWMLAAVFFALAAVMPIVSFMVSLVGEQGGDESHLGLALFLMAASELPAALLFPALHRRLGSGGTLALSVVFMGPNPLFFLLAPDLWWLLAVQPVQMLGYGLFTPASVYYANENVSQADRIQGQSVMMMASNGLGAMFGNLLAGYAVDWGGCGAMLGLCLGLGAVGMVCCAVSLRTGRRR